MDKIFLILLIISSIAAIGYLLKEFKWQILPFMMGTVYPFFGNSIIMVILNADGTFPTLTQWNGSTGNIHFYKSLAQDNTESNIEPQTTKYKTNDDQPYAIKVDQEGITKARLYSRKTVDVTWITVACKNAIRDGKKVLEIVDLGYHDAAYEESFKIGDVVPQRQVKDNDPLGTMYEHHSTPPPSAFTLSGANITAIETVSATNYVVRAAGPVVIPSDQPEILVTT